MRSTATTTAQKLLSAFDDRRAGHMIRELLAGAGVTVGTSQWLRRYPREAAIRLALAMAASSSSAGTTSCTSPRASAVAAEKRSAVRK